MSMEDIIKLLKAQKEEQKSDIQEMFKQQREEEKKEREKEKEALGRHQGGLPSPQSRRTDERGRTGRLLLHQSSQALLQTRGLR